MSDLDTVFEVVVAEPLVIDHEVYHAWLLGVSVEQVARHCQNKRTYPHLQPSQQNNLGWHIARHCQDQYRSFEILQPFLCEPRFMSTQLKFQLPTQVQKYLVESYYGFEDSVLRVFLGKKLTSKLRKDLDVVSDKSGATIHSCRRQVENLRRLGNAVLHSKPRSVEAFLVDIFHLSPQLARRYSRVLFLCLNRIDMTKKKLLALSFRDCETCASALVRYLCDGSAGSGNNFGSDITIDTRLADALSDLKSICNERDTTDQYRTLVLEYCGDKMRADKLGRLDSRFSAIITKLLGMGDDVHQPKEFRDFISDIAGDKLCDNFRRCEFTINDIQVFFQALQAVFRKITSVTSRDRDAFGPPWTRFLDGVQACVVIVYQRTVLKR